MGRKFGKKVFSLGDIFTFRSKKINKTSKKRKKSKLEIKKKTGPINKKHKCNDKHLDEIMNRRFGLIIVLLISIYLVIGCRLFNLQILKNSEYNDKLAMATEKTIESTSAPRGRIYDRNHKLLVDNEGIKTIYYKKQNGITTKEEIELAYEVSNNIDIDYSKIDDNKLKDFYYKSHYKECRKKITDEEWDLYNKRKLNDKDIDKLIYERLDNEISEYTDSDKKAAYIYYLMNKGYSYAEKVIKNSDVTDAEYAYISENIDNLKGFNTKLDWERVYLYGDTFKSILGNVSSNTQGIPSELSEDYLKRGYTLDDRVGISYLEYQYEDYLRGTKAKYRLLSDNSYELVSEGKRGNDIVLTIDIELQKYLEEVLSNEVLNAKGEPGTQYYNRSFAIVSDPNTGEILAMAGKQAVLKDGYYQIVDYTPGIVTLPVTPGSVVKGASMMVGYKYGAIDIGTVLNDECIKIKDTPLKCSWQTMGPIDDVYALQNSSNVYQYKIAIKVGNGSYEYNQGLALDESAFDKYREMYAEFGLGEKTGIDLPVESLGFMGKSRLPGHLLDFSIGQYDTYTPIQLSQYINTIANNGVRLKPYLLKEVYKPSDSGDTFGSLIYKANVTELGKLSVEKKYIDRVREGFSAVVTRGLGYGYMGNYTNSAGKTGTSQSFIDTDGDGKVDTETITSSFVGYSPGDNPKMSIVVVSPDISVPDSTTYGVTRNISAQVVNKYFELNG